MKTAKSILTGIFLLASVHFTNAQGDTTPLKALSTGDTYNTAIGLRAGETSGLTFKKFVGNNRAFDAILGVWSHGFSFTLLHEWHAPAFGVTGLNWYYGLGGHASLKHRYFFRYYDNGRYYYYQYSNLGLGIDGVAGIEYKIPKTPLALSIDVKPYVEVISNGGIWSSIDPGLGIKLTF